MYVCNCNGLTESNIKDAIDSGAIKAEDTLKHHGCLPRCCGCLNGIQHMINDNKDQGANNDYFD